MATEKRRTSRPDSIKTWEVKYLVELRRSADLTAFRTAAQRVTNRLLQGARLAPDVEPDELRADPWVRASEIGAAA